MKKVFLMLMLVLLTMQAFAQTSSDNTLQVWMDQRVELTADGTTVTYLTVYEYDPNQNYVAFNMALSVPKGTKVHQSKDRRVYVNDIKLNTDRKADHIISCGMPDDRTIKIIAYSPTNMSLFPDKQDGGVVKELFTVGLVSDNSTINGCYRAEMRDVVFVVREDDGNIYGNIIDHTEYSDFVVVAGQDFAGVDYTMTSAGYGTLILPFDCEIPAGLTVFECDGVDDNCKLVLNKVNSFAANTPYILKGSPASYHFEGVYKALFDEYATPYMTGVFANKKVPVGAYVLQNQADEGLAFYRVYDGTDLTISPYRCYINCLGDDTDRSLRFPDDNYTDAANVEISPKELVDVFTSSGIKVKSLVEMGKALEGLPAGVYIINNNKVIKK